LNIEKEILENRQAKLTVTYATDEFEGYKRRAAKRISKNVKIPGFRPGKAPYNVILNHYGEGAIIQEAIDILLDTDYGKILEQAEIEPSGTGNLEKIESYDPPTFIFIVPLEPIVNLGDYREIRKPYELEEFNESEVDEFIENLRRNAATIVPADRPAKEGDLVYFTLSGEFLNPAEDENATITDKTPQQALIPEKGTEKEDEWPYPGFASALEGVQSGDVKELQFTYPDDFEDEEFKGKTAIFTVEVQSIKELDLPEFDDEFVKTMGEYESTDGFREAVEERLRKQHQDEYDEQYFNDLLNEITEMAELVYPPQMVEHEEEHILDDLKSRLENQNMEFETYLKLRNTDEEKFIEEEIHPVAIKRLERSLVVDALIDNEGLKINRELLNEHINGIMNEVLYSGNLQEMQKQMGKDEFSRAITMEGVSRTMNAQVYQRLKLIATGQPIPEDDETSELDESSEAVSESTKSNEESSKDEDSVEEKMSSEIAEEPGSLPSEFSEPIEEDESKNDSDEVNEEK
jgi:trigger factor